MSMQQKKVSGIVKLYENCFHNYISSGFLSLQQAAEPLQTVVWRFALQQMRPFASTGVSTMALQAASAQLDCSLLRLIL
jgi:hypothetical protein